jgi:hypothetical protein
MIRIALSAKAAYVFARIPGMPDPDVAMFDAETSNTVLIWNDDTRIKEINNARHAAANVPGVVLSSASWSKNSLLYSKH